MYRLYLDEVGTDDLNNLDKDNHRYLSLTGTIIDRDHVRDILQPNLLKLKQSCFDFDPDDKVCLHRSDIVRRRGIFGQLNENAKRELFDKQLRTLLVETNYTVVTVLVDKLEMTKRSYWEQQHPYHFLMEVLVEKYAQFLERHNAIGDIMPEARRGKKDRALQQAFEEVRLSGTRYVSSGMIESTIRAKYLKFRTKNDEIAGLQLCDLIAHPSHICIRDSLGHPVKVGDFATVVREILHEAKYDRSKRGKIDGYGIKFLP